MAYAWFLHLRFAVDIVCMKVYTAMSHIEAKGLQLVSICTVLNQCLLFAIKITDTACCDLHRINTVVLWGVSEHVLHYNV